MLVMRLVVLLFGMLIFHQSYAGVVLNGTRVIYKEGQREAQVHIDNNDEKPYLLQNWIDDGQVDALPTDIQVPFVISPPISRIEANSGLVLRIFYTENSLPDNVESVFWLNVLAAPSKNKSLEGKNQLQVAFRTRIKLFYRPKSLSSLSLSKSLESIIVRRVGNEVKINNKTPFHLSISKLTIQSEGKVYEIEGNMISPKQTSTYRFYNLRKLPQGATFNIYYINDYGGTSVIERTLE
ncbi:p pilus assembly protein chaperone PapD [Vibrio sp. RC586]|uniref:fimbrial biogenesis chaperone n=1 Tax=Vibrio sp. RC586 TaxID=675815 RepID=UPI0001BB805D|nr:molecular chaperone [Vibrio sp. RC586]EEY99521.1 p pilus assembly protein chaperone PapD [Vibrio sp. RC586]